MHLPTLGRGEIGIVGAVVAGWSSAKRLADMGFVPGAELEMVKPGNPCIVRLDETCVGLGTGHQQSIQLRPM